MYIFSASAKTRKAIDGFRADEQVPFIVYIDFKDLFGAEKLCQLYLLNEGFYEVKIEKRKMVPEETLLPMIDKDKAIQETLETGYMIQMFDAH